MRHATLFVLLLTLASCDTTTNDRPPFRVLIEAVVGSNVTVLADVEVPRSALASNSLSIEPPRGVSAFTVSAEAGTLDSTGVFGVVSTLGPDTDLLRFGTAGSSQTTIFRDDATSVVFISTDSLWTGPRESFPVRVETGLTSRVDTLRRDRHRATPVRLFVEARGLPVAETDLRISVYAPRDLRLAPVATLKTGLPIPGGAEEEQLYRTATNLLRASLGDRARYTTRIEDVARAPEAGPLNFDVELGLLLVRVGAGQ